MAMTTERRVRIIKRNAGSTVGKQIPSLQFRTPAQAQRIIVSTVASWIKDYKASNSRPAKISLYDKETVGLLTGA